MLPANRFSPESLELHRGKSHQTFHDSHRNHESSAFPARTIMRLEKG